MVTIGKKQMKLNSCMDWSCPQSWDWTMINFRPVDELFSTKTGPPLYRALMSRNRFKELVRCIRFDDMSTRATRKGGEQGRIAPIS